MGKTVTLTLEGNAEDIGETIQKFTKPSPELEEFIKVTGAAKVKLPNGEWVELPRMGETSGP